MNPRGQWADASDGSGDEQEGQSSGDDELLDERRRYLQEAAAELGEDQAPQILPEPILMDHRELREWHAWKPRNSQFTHANGHKCFIKVSARDTSVKITQWNSDCVKSAWAKVETPPDERGEDYDSDNDDGHDWIQVQDRVPLDTKYCHDYPIGIIVCIHAEGMIMPHNHQSPPREVPNVAAAKRRCFGSKQRKQYWHAAYNVYVNDSAMWSTLAPYIGGGMKCSSIQSFATLSHPARVMHLHQGMPVMHLFQSTPTRLRSVRHSPRGTPALPSFHSPRHWSEPTRLGV